ncbi:hypothetical protein F66182_1886 [Fusarium sp. NRRL 66182]|nr:hypothetical protein F66182_1886 [Fusarium sp. NRRL 66182]
MASELEGLIAGLVHIIACGGEQGCPVNNVLEAIHNSSKTHTQPPTQLPNDVAEQDRTASTIWGWLSARKDISIGPNREYNHLSLDEVLALPPPTDVDGQDAELTGSNLDDSKECHHVRVYASEATLWESLTGHGIDYKRIPKSEWMLLLGIASTTTQGLLQSELTRLTNQDKRSTPKRTDTLFKKGYIVKRTTLVRGMKTSKLWCRAFAPPLPKEGDGTDELRSEMTLTRQVLLDSIEPVPWHHKWTGESVDYTALATTISAVAREWGVIRMKDMKSKLGVLGMRWQMKVLAKVCRFLNARGVIQYVAAKLEEKVFKDCVKYVRDLNSEDWGLYLATGKRQGKPPKNPDLDGLDGSKQLVGQASNVSEISKAPPWSLDMPVPVIIAEMAQRLGDVGLTNPDVYALTTGPSFSRHLSSMTTALSVPNLQPPHLSHFQIRSEHTRSGKIASYRYFATNTPSLPPQALPDTTGQSPAIDNFYGFSSFPPTKMSCDPSATLTDLCNMGMANRKTKGRPKKPKEKKQKPTSTPKSKMRRKRCSEASQIPPQGEEVQENGAPEEEAVVPQIQETITQEPDIPSQNIQTQDEPMQLETEDPVLGVPVCSSKSVDRLVVTLKVSVGALKELLAKLEPDVATPARPTRTRSTSVSVKKAKPKITSPPANDKEVQTEGDVDNELENAGSNTNPLSGRKRGRPKRGELRKKGNAQTGEGDTASKPWVCEKCGGSWKNDLGLKYHLEKSRTKCNPSFDESMITPVRRGKKRAISEVEDQDQDTTTPIVDEPQDEDQGTLEKGDQGKAQENEPEQASEHEDTPAPKRVSKLRGPVAARPTWASRPTLSFKAGALQVNPELRRPPVASFDSPRQPLLSNGSNGALVQSENSQPRPVLGSLDRFTLLASSPKTPRSKPQRKGSQSVSTPQPEQHVANGTPNGHVSTTKPKTPTAIDSPLPKAIVNDRVFQIVQSILEEQSGAFPGGKPLWLAITIRWAELFPTEAVPQSRAYQAAFRELVKNKTVAEHWLTFRSSKGVTEKCHLVVQAGVDPFSSIATGMSQKIQEVHPDPYLPAPFNAHVTNDLLKRGRRDLPDEVEMLDAPVYVARAAEKRAQDEFDDDGDDFPPPSRRSRKRRRMAAEGRPSKTRDGGERLWYEHFESSYGVPEDVQFLVPNTFLEEDAPEGLETHLTSDYGTALQQATSSHFAGELAFDKPILLSGYDGVWPYLSFQDFEMQDASYTLRGWMPDKNWFAWSSMIEMIDRKAHSLNRQRLQHQDELDPYQCLVERLYCCMDLERAWSESFIHAPVGAAGPCNIFVSFSTEADNESVEIPAISWPSEWQLTPRSFPGDVPDRALLVDSPSSEEDDSPEWPSFPSLEPMARNTRVRTSTSRQLRARGSAGRRRTSVSRPQASISRQQQPRVKRVRLVTRALMPIPEETTQSQSLNGQSSVSEGGEEAERLLAALIAVRVLLGGADKSIDWGLMLKIFPNLTLKDIRRFWVDTRREQGAYVKKLTKDFQDKFLIAYEKGELEELDFREVTDYDWDALIDWTLELPRRKGIDLPSTRQHFEENFTSDKITHNEEDPREKFYNPQSSVYSRFESATCNAPVVTVDRMLNGLGEKVELTEAVIARSWVRSLCCTDESRYSPDQIKQKFSTLAAGDQEQINLILKEAIDTLTKQRIICKSKRPPLSGRPYRLNEWCSHMLGKLAQRSKYQEAADFKAKLDAIFRRGETYKVPFTLDQGTMMVLTNMNASERIRLVQKDIPDIPMGFRPFDYESRKLPKASYVWDIEVVPTDTYKYDEDIDVLRKSINEGPATAGKDKDSVLPQWVDFFGRRDAQRWMDVLGAFCFILATRGFLTIEGMCTALHPVLEPFEADMIGQWGLKTGVLKESEDGLGLLVGEWWWLAIPYQFGRQLRWRGRRDDD